ncbi:hypothetical protein D3C87_1642580 [compost metagenome]
MLATPAVFAVVNVATGEAAEMVNPFHRLPIDSLSRRLQGVALEQGERYRQAATGEETAAQRRLATLHTQGIGQRAGRVRAVGLTGYPQI